MSESWGGFLREENILMKNKKVARSRSKSIELFRRKETVRSLLTSVLVVTEGQTEETYLKDFANDKKLHERRIQIRKCPVASDPLGIVNYAITQDQEALVPYDAIYCVIDAVGNTTLQQALTRADEYKKKVAPRDFILIISYPCFEYWIFMHFSNSTSPHTNGKAMCNAVKQHMTDYKKNMAGLYERTKDGLGTAIKNSKSTLNQALEIDAMNPSTNMHILIAYLTVIATKEA